MRPIQLFFLFVCALSATLAMGEPPQANTPIAMNDTPQTTVEGEGTLEQVDAPVFAIKLRGLPLLSGLASSLNAGRFNHSLMLDFEGFVAPGYSVGLAIGHSRLTIGGDSVLDTETTGNRYDYFIQETQIGVLLTHYFNARLAPASFYLRAHGFAVLPETESQPVGNGVIPVNQGQDNFGFRTGLELGWVFRAQSVVVDMGAGFSAHVKNPYSQFSGENKHGVPASVSNLLFGVSDVYPTLNFSLGILL